MFNSALLEYLVRERQRQQRAEAERRADPILQANTVRLIGAFAELLQSYAEQAAFESGDESPFRVDQYKADLLWMVSEFVGQSRCDAVCRAVEVKPFQLTETHVRYWFKTTV